MSRKQEYLPLSFLKKYHLEFPKIWEDVEDMRRSKGESLPDWDNRCYIPIAGILASLSQGNNDMIFSIADKAAIYAALAPWRKFKEVYRFSTEMEELLYQQADDIVVPIEALSSLPYPCIYIEANIDIDGDKVHGFFAHIEHDQNTQNLELRFLFLTEKDMRPYPIALHLIEGGTIKDGLEEMFRVAQRNINQIGGRFPLFDIKTFNETNCTIVGKAIQLVLYICASNAEIAEDPQQSKITRRSVVVKDKFSEVRRWDVATRIAVNIRKAGNIIHMEREEKETPLTEGRRSPRPHIRRGHWHHFWTGSQQENNRKLILRWVEPTFINSQEERAEELPVVIREINKN